MTTTTKGARPIPWREAWRLAHLGGAEERLRRGLILVCSALAMVPLYAAATLPGAAASPVGYGLIFLRDRSTWVGIAVVLFLAAVPVVHLAVLVARVGGPARDSRLAAMRASGARRVDIRRVVRAEAIGWSVPGALLGVGVGALLWWLCTLVVLQVSVAERASEWDEYISSTRRIPLLPQAWPDVTLLAAAVLAIPVLAGLLSTWSVRKIEVGSMSEAAAAREVRRWPTVALAVIALSCGAIPLLLVRYPVERWTRTATAIDLVVSICILAGPVILLAALTSCVPWATSGLGRMLSRRGATAMLAGRAMAAQPRRAARASAALLLVGLTGGLMAAGGSIFEQDLRSVREGSGLEVSRGGTLTPEGVFYLAPVWSAQALVVLCIVVGLLGITVATAEHAMMRRTWAARALAGGVPGATLRRAMTIETGLPAAVMGSVSLVCGVLVPVGVMVFTGRPDLVAVPWTYLAALLVLLALAPFAAAALAARITLRGDVTQELRDR